MILLCLLFCLICKYVCLCVVPFALTLCMSPLRRNTGLLILEVVKVAQYYSKKPTFTSIDYVPQTAVEEEERRELLFVYFLTALKIKSVTGLVSSRLSPGCSPTRSVSAASCASFWIYPDRTLLQSAERTPGRRSRRPPLLRGLWPSCPSAPGLSSAAGTDGSRRERMSTYVSLLTLYTAPMQVDSVCFTLLHSSHSFSLVFCRIWILPHLVWIGVWKQGKCVVCYVISQKLVSSMLYV